MKKSIYIISILLTGAIILMFSCTKENQMTDRQSAKSNLSPKDLHVNKLIKNFKDKVAYHTENPGLKSGEAISADSALWYLEATINYSHGFPNEYYGQFEVDTFYLSIAFDASGTINMEALTQKYDEMKTNIADDYHNSAFAEKGLSYVDLSEVSQNSDEVIFMVESGTGEKGTDPGPGGIGIDGPFEEGDDYYYGEWYGKCDPHTWDTDAANELAIAMNNDIPDPNGNYYFINLTTLYRKGGEPNVRRDNDPDPINNAYDYYLYSSRTDVTPFNSDMLCLGYNDMNIYFSYLQYLLYTKIPGELPPGYAVESVTSILGNYETIAGNHTHYFHRGTFVFGEVISGSPSDLPTEL